VNRCPRGMQFQVIYGILDSFEIPSSESVLAHIHSMTHDDRSDRLAGLANMIEVSYWSEQSYRTRFRHILTVEQSIGALKSGGMLDDQARAAGVRAAASPSHTCTSG
jgi:hypothetical protein